MERIVNFIPPFVKEIRLGWAMREVWREGYNNKQLAQDIQSGLLVAVVALPLAMALAIASGVPPQHGLYTSMIGGFIIAALGGSRFQVSGPTAAFVVLLLPIVQKFGIGGLLLAGFMAGLMCIAYGVMRLGDIIQYVPHPVTTGYTSGIALLIATFQLKDLTGIDNPNPSSDFIHRVIEIAQYFHTFHLFELLIGVGTLLIIIYSGRFIKMLPSPIVALTIVTLAVWLIQKIVPDFDVATISSRFGGVPQGFPKFQAPWQIFQLNWLTVKEILPSAFAISLLGSIESLLSATVADGMTGKKHNPNSELIALGIGNLICPFFGGIPATGAISRTTTNIRGGAVSPVSGIMHSVFILIAVLAIAPLIGFIPMAGLAGLLMFVAWGMSERHHFFNILKNGAWDDRFVLLSCFGLTVLFDMTIGVGASIILSSALFIRRMALLTQTEVVQKSLKLDSDQTLTVGDHVLYYRIHGSLFFGAAQRAMERLSNLSTKYTHAVIDLDEVHFIDMTGLIALDSALKRMRSMNLKIAVIAPEKTVQDQLLKLEWLSKPESGVKILKSRAAAVYWAHPAAATPATT